MSEDPMYFQNTVLPSQSLTAEEETALVQRMRQGDDEARLTLFESHMRWAYSLARRISDDDDVASAANDGLWAALERFKPELGRFATYAYRFVIGRCLNRFGECRRLAPEPAAPELVYEPMLGAEELEVEFQHKVSELVSRLPIYDAQVITLFMEGMSTGGIADKLGGGKQKVWRRLQDVLQSWRKEFGPEYRDLLLHYSK